MGPWSQKQAGVRGHEEGEMPEVWVQGMGVGFLRPRPFLLLRTTTDRQLPDITLAVWEGMTGATETGRAPPAPVSWAVSRHLPSPCPLRPVHLVETAPPSSVHPVDVGAMAAWTLRHVPMHSGCGGSLSPMRSPSGVWKCLC